MGKIELEGMAQSGSVPALPTKCKALSSNPSTTKNKHTIWER
jgi:hypothetical protein